ncbi:ESTs gb/T44179, gb/T20783 and gb/AA395386 come from this gene [Arabidopsis thaliana]|uniref:At1g52550 n=2 Tax=Arabidopsis thaliana TaxID=3702 RepID=Q9SSQ7_ARATH|nr:uncharacterized protein AT1G52550 [Arabidopsis thaliana]AAD55609.1 ESTs gb/T44179, gb/T20783 and gb/AA395386 come from this gene [Arabidopsis thaliana]AAM63063.1 unknown [Arabidopsis thaliana]AAO42973.1 At1g52550 [Arabidopsis thaliana]AEE32821.1 transmembrane protein [Arabidopsis thaliana]CAA0289627.1 unnamed protein product [Arabidopsis thaliana]|eukprot:NP_564610.1 transmembrane protein [Arabidopsis thaliana]
MATAFANTTSSSNLYLHRCRKNHPLPSPSFFSPFRSSPLPSQTLFLVPTPKPVRRIAVAPLGPPTPPSPDPPPPKNTTELTSLVGVASMIQDRVKIFLSVLIWISLFFWASALQGRGSKGNGKGKKGSRFK